MMKNKYLFSLLLALSLHVASAQTIALDALYATSTAENSDVRHLFDQDPSTVWMAAPGAGIDEGILLRFAQPTMLTGIEVQGVEGSFADNTGLMDLSLDGKTLFQSLIGSKLDLRDATNGPIREIYLRITHTGWETSAVAEKGVYFHPENRPVGLKSLRLFGQNGQELRLVPPAVVSGTATAKGSLSPAYAYGPERLFDGRLEMAWATANTESQALEFNFDVPVRITALKIWNGYQRSPESFQDNHRLHLFEFGATGGAVEGYSIEDSEEAQLLTLAAPLSGKSFQLNLLDYHVSKKYKDLAISELVFYDGDKPFVLSVNMQTAASDLRKRADKTPMKEILNRGCRTYQGNNDQDHYQLLTLRDDGTFSLATLATKIDESETISIGSGHWEIKDVSTGVVQVRITGRLRSAFQALESKAPIVPTVRTFSETLSIDQNTLQGQKVVKGFRFKG